MAGHHFISYSRHDANDFAVKLKQGLDAGQPSIKVWRDKDEIRPGDDWYDEIFKAIINCKTLLLVMSRDSVADSAVVRDEWELALTRGKPVVPLMLHADAVVPFRLAARQYIPFYDDFDTGIEQLRAHLLWLDSPAGQIQTLRSLGTDKRRELRRVSDDTVRKRLEGEIARIDEQIHKLENVADQDVTASAPPLLPPTPPPAPVKPPSPTPDKLLDKPTLPAQPAPPIERIEPIEPVKGPSGVGVADAPQDDDDVTSYEDITGFDTEDPPPDVWYRKLRPVLHQATHYSVPTYFLDENLKVIDWNVAFELISRT